MNFKEYVLKHKYKNNPIGDFAKDVIRDANFPTRPNSQFQIEAYLSARCACDGAKKSAKTLFLRWQNEHDMFVVHKGKSIRQEHLARLGVFPNTGLHEPEKNINAEQSSCYGPWPGVKSTNIIYEVTPRKKNIFDTEYNVTVKHTRYDDRQFIEELGTAYGVGLLKEMITDYNLPIIKSGCYLLQMTYDPSVFVFGKTKNIVQRIQSYRTHLPQDFRIVLYSDRISEEKIHKIISLRDDIAKLKTESFRVLDVGKSSFPGTIKCEDHETTLRYYPTSFFHQYDPLVLFGTKEPYWNLPL